MVWGNRLCLFGVSEVINVTCTTDEIIGDLFAFLGSPAIRSDVTFTVDACDIGGVSISTNFAVGSTFQFDCINGGRILGFGGSGGNGGNDFGGTGTGGFVGSNGQPAINSVAFDVGIDIDDGFLLGGGGGGGGGSYNNTGVGGTPGGGGGGGTGFSPTAGGLSGSGSPSGLPGDGGDNNGPGVGGAGGTSGTNDGNIGGTWGAGGIPGDTTDMLGAPIPASFFYNGGSGGAGGNAFFGSSGATITFNGITSEVTLRASNRLMGETEHYIVMPHEIFGFESVGGATTHGWSFLTDGTLRQIRDAGNQDYAAYWINNGKGVPSGTPHSIRASSLGKHGSWDSTPVADDTYIALSANRQWSFTSNAVKTTAQLFEIKRTTRPDEEILASGFLAFTDENNV